MPKQPAGPLALIAESGFRRLWLAGTLIGTTRWLEFLATSVYIFELTGSPAQVAFLTMLRMVPLPLLGAVVGALGERVSRRRLLIAIIAGGVVAAAFQMGLAWDGRLAFWHVALGTLWSGVIWATEMPLRRTMLGELAGPGRTAPAMGLDAATNNGTRMLGPPLGGLLLELVGLHGAFALAMLLYVASLWLLWGLAPENTTETSREFRLITRILDGVRVIRNDRSIVGTLAVTIVFNVFAWPAASLVPVIGEQNLQLTAFPIGLLIGADGLGALIGAMLVATWVRPGQFRGLYLLGVAGFSVASAAFALSPWTSLAAGTQLIVGLSGACFASLQPTIIFLSSPIDARTRIMGVLSVCIGTSALGFLHIGLLAAWLGAQAAILVTSVEGLVALYLVLIFWPEVRPGAPLRAIGSGG